jgi:hypothetical protein
MVGGKVSTAKGKSGNRKPRQKYQNTFAYQPSKYSTQAQVIAKLPVQGLCKKCQDIILWRWVESKLFWICFEGIYTCP